MIIKDAFLFLREGLTNFRHTGSICATSHWAAKALTNPLRDRNCPQSILEVGAGTGSVTVKILKDMIEGDELTICELNPRLMKLLKKRLEDNEDYNLHKNNIRFFTGLIQDLSEDRSYDVIVSALPFLNFDVKTVQEIFNKLSRLGHEETVMTYYEYIGLRDLGKALPIKERQQRMQELDLYLVQKLKDTGVNRERVWLNFLPINIYTVRLDCSV